MADNTNDSAVLRAAIYARVSTEDQAREGTSLETQLTRCKAAIEMHGWEPAGEFVDEGVSGAKFQRPQLDTLMEKCRLGSVDAIVVAKLDRFTRSTRHLANALAELDDMGIVFVSVAESIDGSTVVGRFNRTILGAVAELEHGTIRERTLEGIRARARSGNWVGGPPPYGFRTVADPRDQRGKARVLEVNEAEAAVIRKATALIIDEGMSTCEAAATLNGLGCPPRKASTWTHINLRRSLMASTLDGRAEYGKWKWRDGVRRKSDEPPIEIPIPRLLPPERYQELQEALNSTSTGPRIPRRAPYPLSGRLRGTCGGSYVGHYRNDRDQRHYRCANRRGSQADRRCNDKPIDADEIELLVWEEVCDLLTEPERLIEMARDYLNLRGSQMTLEREQVEDLDKKVTQLEGALEAAYRDRYKRGRDVPAHDAAVQSLEDELGALRRYRAQVEAWNIDQATQSDRMRKLWELAEVAHQRLTTMSPDEMKDVLRLLDVRVDLLTNRTKDAPAEVRITGTVPIDELRLDDGNLSDGGVLGP